MSEYKLVPFEPTPKMVEAAEEAYMPFGDMDLAIRMAILAAPVVQGEPVGWQFYQDGKWWNGDDRIRDHRKNTKEAGFRVRDVYAALQAECDALRAKTSLSLGVGDGTGNLFVHGDYDSIKRVQALIFECEKLRKDVAELGDNFKLKIVEL